MPSARAAESGYTTGNASGAGATWNDAAFPYDTTFTDANLAASGGGRAVNIGGTAAGEAGEVYNFVFGIPSGATIAGIQVRVEGSSSTAGTTTFQIGLSGNNGASWFEKSASFTGTTDTPSVYGSTTDLWGTTWTSTQVDSTHFRVRIYRTGISTADLRIDRLQVNVTYSVSPTLTTSGFMRVKSGTYNGNGVDGRAVTGLGFQPDLVIVVSGATCANLGSPNNCGHDTVLRSSTMGAGLSKATNQYGQYPNLLSKRITSLDADGFTVGHPADHNPTNDDGAAQPYHCANHNGVTYYWVAFKAAPGEMALGTYVGSGSDTRDPLSPGLLFQPDYVLVMPGNGERVFHRTKDMTSPADSSYDLLGNKFCSSGCTGGLAAISSMQANGFTVGPRANVSGVTYHYVVWKAAAGRTAVGTFTGNGSDSRQFTAANGNGIGLQPEYLSVTRGTTTTTSPGSTTNVRVGATGASSDLSLLYYYSSDSALTPTDRIQKLLADGFELGTSTDVNSSTSPNTYYYVAFAGANPSGSPTTNYRSIGAGGSYSSSTVAVTNASTTVNGNFTQWLTNRRGTGDVFTIDYVNYYTVARVLSETQLELTQTYQGTTNSNVGYSISRQFSTLQAWEDCISKATTCTYFPVASANLVADNRVEIGVAFPGGDFSTLVIDGSITGPTNTITLTTDLRYRHKGILNGGVRLNNSGNNGDAIEIKDDHVTVEWIEVGWGNIDGISVGSPTSTDNKIVLRSNLFHDMSLPTPTAAAVIVESPHTSLDLYNNFMYQFYGNGLKLDPGASWAATSVIRILNNTMYFVSSATCPGVNCRVAYRSMQSANANVLLRNNIASNRGPGDSGSGFDVPARNAASSNNLAGLGDASGVNHSTAGTGLEAEPSFEGTSVHLTAGSPGIDQGADLSAIIPRLDIDAQTRPAGTAWDIGADEYNGFTAVRLASFMARGFDSAVFVEWETATELDNLGFHLYRGLSENGPWERLTQTLIPGLGSSPEGKRYSFLDAGLRNGATYFYRLEDMDRAGRVTSHGPVSATPLAGAGAPPSEPAPPEPTPTPGPPEPGPEGAPPSDWTAHGDPADVSLRVVERTRSSVTFELRTGGFYSLAQENGSQRLFVPGFFDLAEPGFPTLPTRRTWTDAVVGLGARVASVTAEDLLSVDGLVPARAGAPQAVSMRDGTYRAAFRPVKATALSRGLYPRAQARVLQTAFQGDTKKAYVEFSPLRLDASRGRLVLARRLLVTVVFDGVLPGETGIGSTGRSIRLRRRASSEPERLLARFATRSKGLHSVSWEDLLAATSTLSGASPDLASSALMLDTSTVRLSRLGASVPFHVEPRSDRFVPGSTLFFLAEGADAAYAKDAVYELAVAPGGVRMAVGVSSRGRSALPTEPVTSLVSSRRFEKNADYLPGLLEARDPWIWSGFLGGTGVDYPFTLASLAPGAAKLEVDLLGGSDTTDPQDHHVRVSIGGTEVAQAHWDGMTPFSVEVDVPDGVLVEGPNTLRLDSDGQNSSAVYLDRFSLDYPHALAAEAGVLEGKTLADGAVQASGFSPGSVLLDLSGRRTRWLGRTRGTGSLAFAAEAGHDYLAVSPAAILRPEIRPVTPSSLLDAANQADWILIAPEALLSAAEPLVLHRQAQGLSARAVSLERVYDDFGFGEASPDAVREFLAFAYHHWTSPAPRYVLLLGDASYDPKGFFSGTSRKDLLPSPLTKSSFLWTASDPLYASTNGNDLLPDLALGRLTAGSLAEAQDAVEKILSFENAGRTLSGKAVLVADNPDLAGDFEANANDIASLLTSRPVEKIFLTQYGPSTKAAVIGAFDSGPALVSYVGHGSQALWANVSENIFRSPDVDLLQPQPLQPLVLTMTCSNGYFTSPWGNAIAERLTLAPNRGAIAAFSPSGLSLDEAAHLYHRAIAQELEQGNHLRLGDLLLAAQTQYLQTGAFPELLTLYHLFGDPALAVR